MENRKTSMTVDLKGKTYQFNKCDPRTATWLFAFMGSRSAGGTILNGLGGCTRKEFEEIQNLALKTVFSIEDNFPIAVLGPGGQLVGDLANDADLVLRITQFSLTFNLEPFLVASDSNSQTENNQIGQ